MTRIVRRMLLAAAALLLALGAFVYSPVSASIQVICKGVTDAEVKKCDPGYAAEMGKMHWRMYAGHNCTNFVAYQLGKNGVPEPKILMGNARDWAANAKKLGYKVNTTPAVGSVGVWPGKNHVTYVAEVGSGYIVTREDNYPGYYKKGLYQVLKISTKDSSYPDQFIHFKDLVTGATPKLSGSHRVGATVTASAGTWGPSGVALDYRWQRDGVSITSAIKKTYVVTAADKGHRISVRVRGKKSGLVNLTKTSALTPAVLPGILTNSVAPAVSGTTKVGGLLTASAGTWTPGGTAYTYSWLRDGVVVPGAVGATYPLRTVDLDSKITARITATKAGYTTSVVTTAPSAAVGAGTLTNTEPAAIAGSTKTKLRLLSRNHAGKKAMR